MRQLNTKQIAEQYIIDNNLNISVEELFNQFEMLCDIHEQFSIYLKQSRLIYKLNKMRRNKRLKAKRSIFCKWYFDKFQNKPSKVLINELEEMTFVSERTVRDDTFRGSSRVLKP